MADMVATDIAQIETARREYIGEAEAALKLTTDTSRTTFFEPPTHELQAHVFKMLLSSVGEREGVEIKDGRGDWI